MLFHEFEKSLSNIEVSAELRAGLKIRQEKKKDKNKYHKIAGRQI